MGDFSESYCKRRESGGFTDGKEWQSVEKKVKAIRSSRMCFMGAAARADNEKREWGILEVGRA